MRRLVFLAPLAAALVACGGTHAAKHGPGPVVFGRTGGNIRPFRKQVEPNAQLSRQLDAVFGGLKSRQCPGTLPDYASEYIRFDGRTVRVHGNCEPSFSRLFAALSR